MGLVLWKELTTDTSEMKVEVALLCIALLISGSHQAGVAIVRKVLQPPAPCSAVISFGGCSISTVNHDTDTDGENEAVATMNEKKDAINQILALANELDVNRR